MNPNSNHHLPKPLERFDFSCHRLSDHFPVRSTEREENDVEFYRSGGIGIALLGLSPLGNVGDGISPFLASLAANPTFVSWLLAWVIAQSIKMFLNFVVERKWDFMILFSSGGMPSSHSALCMALTTAVAIRDGTAGSLFAVCLAISLVVMYDAIGVRRHAGLHAEILNKIVEDLFQGHPISQRKLKVLLGHTPSQVIAGALLGILVACVCCQGFIVAA
ncbi:Acid phosphatase/vanadium-dependent haloperoxidase-related [Cinnamomum micranthum f. kanehirae]|uniref:Acid phosphatase/vanadium-dependent haloperoxidase-related n=1 Tax=Cinnamomum micranthum f. kanehirae TaxID=337451 RepID=A0A3S3PRS7_9MAGN|nr:Acid phosphatase/vanadium-dependent haloperoxidase-related [Cinnamomum micranthum f. kanehirae]